MPAGEAPFRPRAGCVARARDSAALAEILARVLPRPSDYLVKVTWHGYAPGTYTGPLALDLLLGALPGRAVLLEGHTSSRNVGGAEIDWDADVERHRTWVRQQDVEFLRRTGLAEVIARHGAQYLNVTEAWWDGACAPAEDVRAVLGDVALRNPELAGFVPSALMELRGIPLISFARFKGPTRLGLSNLFGLIPHPLRTEWHGPDITHFASVCCDLARLYGSFFPLFGIVEAFDSAVRWDRKGLYRSRWGNYDLVLTDGLFTVSEGLVGADVLASRLQGQDVLRSGFYDVVRERLGWSAAERRWHFPAISERCLCEARSKRKSISRSARAGESGPAHPLSGDREKSHSHRHSSAVIQGCKGLARGQPPGSATDLESSMFIPRTASALARCFVMIAIASIWTSEAAQDRVAGCPARVERRQVADHAEHLRAVEEVGLVDGRLAGLVLVAGSVEVGGVVELGHVDDVGELAQLLDEPQGLLALDPGLEGHAEPQGAGEEDQEIEPCVERVEEVVDRTELPPRVDVPGEIPEPQEDQADRQGG